MRRDLNERINLREVKENLNDILKEILKINSYSAVSRQL